MTLRILHVDDEPDIREVVELSLGLDPAFTVKSCASGGDALTAAYDWRPDLILCDVMMPVMDGPTTLVRLRERPETAGIPVVFMTARAQTREIEHFRSLGAADVIAKPFDPLTLATFVRRRLCTTGIAALRDVFMRRLHSDAAELTECRHALSADPESQVALNRTRAICHALSGSAGIFGCHDVGPAASVLVDAIQDHSTTSPKAVEHALDTLLARIAEECRRAMVPAGHA